MGKDNTGITGSEFSRISGVSRQAISKLCKDGGLVKNKNGKYNLNDPVNKSWLAKKGKQKKSKVEKPKPEKNKPKPKIEKPVKKKSNIKTQKNKISNMEFEDILGLPPEFKNLTMEEMVLQYLNYPGMKSYAELLDKIMAATKKSVEIKKVRSELIELEWVKSHIFPYLSLLSEQLFDYAGEDKKMLKAFSKIIKDTQRTIDKEIKKIQQIQDRVTNANTQ
jgi:hypothetical protein